MLNQLLKIQGAKKLNTKNQKFILGGHALCSICYGNYGGGVDMSDPNCWGCPLPVPHE